MKNVFFSKYLPLIFLGGLLIGGLITICVRTHDYGITWDEPAEDNYGQAALKWYETLGHDKSFLTASALGSSLISGDLPEHGVIFEVIAAAIQQEFTPADHWQVRHVVTALSGLLGIGAIALCGYELGGY